MPPKTYLCPLRVSRDASAAITVRFLYFCSLFPGTMFVVCWSIQIRVAQACIAFALFSQCVRTAHVRVPINIHRGSSTTKNTHTIPFAVDSLQTTCEIHTKVGAKLYHSLRIPKIQRLWFVVFMFVITWKTLFVISWNSLSQRVCSNFRGDFATAPWRWSTKQRYFCWQNDLQWQNDLSRSHALGGIWYDCVTANVTECVFSAFWCWWWSVVNVLGAREPSLREHKVRK